MEIVSVSVLSKVLSLDHKLKQEKDREKENVGGRPAKLNEKKGDRSRSRARDKKKEDIFFCWKNNNNFCNGGEKMRNASGHQCKVKMSGIEK